MVEPIRVCIDRRPPPRSYAERLALVKGSKWQPGDMIRVRFMDGDPSVQKRVEQHAQAWMKHANVTLLFGNDPDADLRISFRDRGSWSYIGRDCLSIARENPTMNYGWLTPQSADEEVERVTLHEFGHALGCIHEHQNPTGGIKWNKPAVYEYFKGPPNFWSKEDVDRNLFETYSRDLTVYSALDPKSIMMYPIDRRFTLDGLEVGLNRSLSEGDKEFIRQMYP